MFKKIPKALIEKYNLVVVNEKKLEYGFSEYPVEDTHLLWHVTGESPWRMASDVYFSVNQLKWCYYSTVFISTIKELDKQLNYLKTQIIHYNHKIKELKEMRKLESIKNDF